MNRNEPEFPPIRFSTRELPERERISKLREEYARNLLRLEMAPALDGPFHADVSLHALPGLRTARCLGSPMRYDRTSTFASDGDDSIGLIFNLGKKAYASQFGCDRALRTGDAVIMQHQEPSTVISKHHFGLLVPRVALTSRLSNVDDIGMRVIPARTDSIRLLTNYMGMVRDKLVLESPRLRDMVISHIHDLIALALSPHTSIGESSLSAVAHSRLNAALGHIAAHFHQPKLNVADVARHQGVSPRYLQRLIETTGTTFTARITELRLQHAFDLLTGTRGGTRRISEIALQAGFSDISHFNRLFRARFGDTPRGISAQKGLKSQLPTAGTSEPAVCRVSQAGAVFLRQSTTSEQA